MKYREISVEVVGKNVKQERKTRGWTQRKLSIESDLTEPTIVNIENAKAKTKVSLYSLCKIAKAFDVKLENLFY